MIIGIGTDLLELERIRRILEQPHGGRFLERVLTPEERGHAEGRQGRRRLEFVAGRFAAKEAVSKALGCGIGRELGFQDMHIVPDPSGRPVCRLSEAALERLQQLLQEGSVRIHVSITHSESMASAYAVAERLERGAAAE